MKKGKVRKVGNSLGLTLPIELTKALNLHDGDEVTLRIDGDSLIIDRFDADLLSQMKAYKEELQRFKHTFKALD